MITKKPWQSVTVWGVVIYALSMLAQWSQVDIPAAQEIGAMLGAQISQLTELVGQIMAVLGLRRAVGTDTVVTMK